MSLNDEFICDSINFLLNSNLLLIYKKVVLKKYINHYINENNKDIIKDIIKNNNIVIYNYIFLDNEQKNKINYQKSIIQRKQYYQNHKEELCEKRKLKYQENKDKEKERCLNYYYKKKQQTNTNE